MEFSFIKKSLGEKKQFYEALTMTLTVTSPLSVGDHPHVGGVPSAPTQLPFLTLLFPEMAQRTVPFNLCFLTVWEGYFYYLPARHPINLPIRSNPKLLFLSIGAGPNTISSPSFIR